MPRLNVKMMDMASTKEHRQVVLETIADLVEYKLNNHASWDSLTQSLRTRHSKDDYTNDVVDDALQWLSEKGYISNQATMQTSWFILNLSLKGKDFLEDGGDLTTPNNPNPTKTTNNFTFNAPTSFQQGDGNVQNIQFGVSQRQVQSLIQALKDDGDAALAEQIDQDTQSGQQPSKVQGFFGKIVEKIASIGSTVATEKALTSLLAA